MIGQKKAFPSYAQYSIAQLLEAFECGADRMRQAVDGLDENELRERPRGQGTWSIQEVVMHTTDSELQGVYRMRKAFAEPGAHFPMYDQDAWATQLTYQKASAADREISLRSLAQLRELVLPVLRSASERDWVERNGVHPEFGLLTLRNLLELYADHTERHAEQILRMRAMLGKPRVIPSLLPERLY